MASESNSPARVVRFATFEADLQAGELRKSGLKLKLHGQPFEVLAMLLAQPGELVSREQLRDRLWPTDTFVDFDHGVNTAINRLREALGDSADNPRFIETVPRRGYRFIAPVEPRPSPVPASISIPLAPPEPESIPQAAPTASPRERTAVFWVIAALVVLALILAVSVGSLRDRMLGRSARPPIQSIAVLPLVNLSNDVNQDYFADGMTEALTTDLGKIGALRVISRTSVMQYKGTKKSLPQIAQELNVDALIEGTVARSGNHMRITANLLQAAPEKHLWGETYEGEVGDILAVQAQVASSVAREIQVKLTPEEQRLLDNNRPVNPRAHDNYLKGRYLCRKDVREGVDKAIQYFQQAIGEDPNDPLAYAGLAECYSILSWAGDIFVDDATPNDILPKTRDAALRALQLDENLAQAHTSLANVRFALDRNWAGAEQEFKRAIELNPNYSPAYVWYAHYLAAMGRFDESVAEAKRSLELDPFSEFTKDFAEWAFYLSRRYELTIQQSERSFELAPEFPWAQYDLGQAYELTGRSNEAIEAFIKADEIFGMTPERLAEVRKAFRESGAKGYWRKTLSFCLEASRHPRKFASKSGCGYCDYAQHADVAAMQLRVGELDAVFAWLEKAYTSHDATLMYLNADPRWDPIRSDPRFADLVRRIGLPQVQSTSKPSESKRGM